MPGDPRAHGAGEPEGAVADERSYGARVADRDDLEVAMEFVRHVRGQEPSDTERQLLGRALLTADREEVAR